MGGKGEKKNVNMNIGELCTMTDILVDKKTSRISTTSSQRWAKQNAGAEHTHAHTLKMCVMDDQKDAAAHFSSAKCRGKNCA